MSEDQSPSGLRNVDFAVGIVVLLVLLSLAALFFLPAVSSGDRSVPRRNTCANNMRQVGLAMLNRESAHRAFPGYANNVGGRTTSYIVPILPFMERNDLYRGWNDPTQPTGPATVYMEELSCPSNPPADHKQPWLAYVVNSGEASRENSADGVCFDQTKPDAPKVSLMDLMNSDGSQYTLLISENIQADKWTIADVPSARITTTMVWHKDEPVNKDWKINSSLLSGARDDLKFSRPSSQHPGGVNVIFCDGHFRFIGEDIDCNVYRQLMTPDGANSRDPVNRPLNDNSSFQFSKLA